MERFPVPLLRTNARGRHTQPVFARGGTVPGYRGTPVSRRSDITAPRQLKGTDMVKVAKLLDGYRDFYNRYFIEQPEIYRNLVTEGQSPKTLVIACSDSRVDPSILLNTEPGDIFVISNVASLVPPYDSDMSHCHGTSAAIEYAVKHLKVENIVVLGHSHCGGINALVNGRNHAHTFIDTWLDIADTDEIRRICQSHGRERACPLCEKEAVRISVNNLLTFPFVRSAVAEKRLDLHGWYFNLATGSIEIVAMNS